MPADAAPAEPGSAAGAALWQALGWHPDAGQLDRFRQLQELLRRWNERLNLTRLVEGDDYWIAQVLDSLWPLLPLLDAVPAGATAERPAGTDLRVIDVGTGGGFPGLAVAIALPGAQVTLVDSVQRKLDAVAAMAAELGLADRVQVRGERVERTGRQPGCRGRFQLAMARAVAAAPVVAEYLVPLLAPGGQALLYRGQWSSQDQQELARAVTTLNARISACRQRELPGGRGLRTALSVEPTATCPAAYPRPVGVPAKQPLGQTSAASGAASAPRAKGRRPSARSRG